MPVFFSLLNCLLQIDKFSIFALLYRFKKLDAKMNRESGGVGVRDGEKR